MSDVAQGEGWWQALDGKWYPPDAAPVPQAPLPEASRHLPAGVQTASPWARFGSYLLEAILMLVTLWIGSVVWAAMTAGTGQTPAKRLLGLRVISAENLRPVGLGKMFWVRGFLGGLVASIAIPLTLGILLLMPFWDRRNQNLWDKVSGTYVVSDPNDHWRMKPDLRR